MLTSLAVMEVILCKVAHSVMLLSLHFIVLLLVHTLLSVISTASTFLRLHIRMLRLLRLSVFQTSDHFFWMNIRKSIRKIRSISLF